MSGIRHFSRHLLDLFGELLAPSRCAACDEPVRLRTIFCPACASAVERSPAPRDGSFVGREAHSLFVYGGSVATAIARLKYAGCFDLGPRFGALMAAGCPLNLHVDVVVPVALHPRRLALRGYNQAALLAAPIARVLGATYLPRGLARTRDTPKQAALDRAARLSNVEDAFAVRACVSGQRVLLVDDVTTTGATLEACRCVLTRAGASDVRAFVLAQALKA